MRLSKLLLASFAVASLTAAAPASADPIGKGLVMYMQMGGNPGDGSTLARQTGAKEASECWASTSSRSFPAGRQRK